MLHGYSQSNFKIQVLVVAVICDLALFATQRPRCLTDDVFKKHQATPIRFQDVSIRRLPCVWGICDRRCRLLHLPGDETSIWNHGSGGLRRSHPTKGWMRELLCFHGVGDGSGFPFQRRQRLVTACTKVREFLKGQCPPGYMLDAW